MITDIPKIADCGCPDETQKPLNESDASKDACGDLATYPEPCPKGLMDLYCTKWTGSADAVFGINPGDRGSVVLVKIMEKIKGLHGLSTPATLLPVNNIIVSGITANTVNLSWGAVAGATRYDLRYRAQGEASWQSINSIAVTNIQLTSLTPGTIYEYGLMARDATTAYSPWTATATFETIVGRIQLAAPVGLASTNQDPFHIVASWTAVPSATSYEVRVRKVGFADPLIIVPGLLSEAGNIITVPEPGANYEWTVIAKADGYKDSVESAVMAILALPPNAPIFTVSDLTATTLTMSWPAIPGAAKYAIHVIIPNTIQQVIPNILTNSQAVGSLIPNTFYELALWTYNSAGVMCQIPYRDGIKTPA